METKKQKLKEVVKSANLIFDTEHTDVLQLINPYVFNMLVGGWGCGKSISALKMVIDDFIANNKKFAIVRRTTTTVDAQFGEIVNFYNNIKLYYEREEKTNKSLIYIAKIDENGEEQEPQFAGYLLALSSAPKYKSTSFLVETVVFDEFLKDTCERRVSTNEAETFIRLVETIARDRTNVTILMLANAMTLKNDYFEFWGVNIDTLEINETYRLNDVVYLTLLAPDTKYIERKSKTLVFKATQNTALHKNAYSNEFNFPLAKYVRTQKQGASASKDDLYFYFEQRYYWVNKKYISEKEIHCIPARAKVITTEHLYGVPNQKILSEDKFAELTDKLTERIKGGTLYFADKQTAANLSRLLFAIDF